MNNRKLLRKYVGRFIARLKPSLRQGYDIRAIIYPARAKGAIVEMRIVEASKPTIKFTPDFDTVNRALKGIEQRLIGGNIDSVSFSGTNAYLEGDRILLIKGDDSHAHWSNSAVEVDLKKILSSKDEHS